MLWVLQRIFIFNVKLFVMHIVHDHVHPAQVVGGGVALLSVKLTHFLYFLGHPQQQGAGTTGRVIHTFQFRSCPWSPVCASTMLTCCGV